MKVTALGLAGLLTAAGLTACGGGSTNTQTSSAGCQGSVAIASVLPSEGPQAEPLQRGIQLAVAQANAARQSNGLNGCSVSWTNHDDATGAGDAAVETASVAATAMHALARSATTVGVIGPLTTAAAAASIPVANAAGLTLISATATDPGLTVAGTNPSINTDALQPTGTDTFFRVCANDLAQATSLASLATATLHARSAYVIDDTASVGQDLATRFAADFEALGGTVTGTAVVPAGSSSYSQALPAAASSDLVFYAGSGQDADVLLRQMRAAGMSQAILGGGGMVTAAFAAGAAGEAGPVYAVSTLPDPAHLASARDFVKQYTAAFGSAPDGNAAGGYDAAGILIQAAEEAIANNGGSLPGQALRALVRSNVAGISHRGPLGSTSFDPVGDTTNGVATVWQLRDGTWVYDTSITAAVTN